MEQWIIYYLMYDGSIGKHFHKGDLFSMQNIVLDGAIGGGDQSIIKIEKTSTSV